MYSDLNLMIQLETSWAVLSSAACTLTHSSRIHRFMRHMDRIQYDGIQLLFFYHICGTKWRDCHLATDFNRSSEYSTVLRITVTQ